jgi:hypothetical protein
MSRFAEQAWLVVSKIIAIANTWMYEGCEGEGLKCAQVELGAFVSDQTVAATWSAAAPSKTSSSKNGGVQGRCNQGHCSCSGSLTE